MGASFLGFPCVPQGQTDCYGQAHPWLLSRDRDFWVTDLGWALIVPGSFYTQSHGPKSPWSSGAMVPTDDACLSKPQGG